MPTVREMLIGSLAVTPDPRRTQAELADGYVGVIAHECSTCHGAGAIATGEKHERHGNVYEVIEGCPTCLGEGFIYEDASRGESPIITGYRERRHG